MPDPVAEFLARGGKITRLPSDARTLTEREIYLAQRGEAPDPIEQRMLGAPDHLGRQAIYNGLGEFIGYA